MKNIHLLPTDNPTNLVFEKFSNRYFTNRKRKPNTKFITNQHIYITNDEEIKEGDWCHTIGTSLFNEQIGRVTKQVITDNGKYGVVFKKIILTTDDQLINDGIQAIDDDFLEWFVKNPSCEEVEIYRSGNHYDGAMEFYHPLFYNTIIPKQDFILVKEDIKLIGEEPTITITLNKEEARGLLACIMRTHASGTDLDVGEMVEDKLVEFLNS